jgi:hypothetical protein
MQNMQFTQVKHNFDRLRMDAKQIEKPKKSKKKKKLKE